MELPEVVLGVIFGLIWFLVDLERKQQRQSRPQRTTAATATGAYPTRPSLPRPVPPQPPRQMQSFPSIQAIGERVPTKTLIQTWRSSIVSLIRLSQRNLTYAKQCLERADSKAAVEAAVTSTENMSRALLHCYGEKPELGSGQVEALELLGRRFAGNDSADFKKAVEEITKLYQNSTVHMSLLKPDVDCTFDYAKAKTIAESILDSASKVSAQFCRIMEEHFATEIPELEEVCPKCHAIDVSVMSFSETIVRFTCMQCRHNWNEPRSY